jgi:hypothetical protein
LKRRTGAIVVLAAVIFGVWLALGARAPVRVAGWTWGEESRAAAAPIWPTGWKWNRG